MSIDVSQESRDFEAWHEQQRQNADYINGSEKHRAWMAWLARAVASGVDVGDEVQRGIQDAAAEYARGVAPCVRLLTRAELDAVLDTESAPGEPKVLEAIQRKFCEANGLTLCVGASDGEVSRTPESKP